MKKTNIVFITTICFLFFLNNTADAYINPGSGSYIFQVLIGGILSIIYFIKNSILKIVKFFKEKTAKKEDILNE